jgi:hypothetical protein
VVCRSVLGTALGGAANGRTVSELELNRVDGLVDRPTAAGSPGGPEWVSRPLGSGVPKVPERGQDVLTGDDAEQRAGAVDDR